jgi:amino acid adenylation domain-containing protein
MYLSPPGCLASRAPAGLLAGQIEAMTSSESPASFCTALEQNVRRTGDHLAYRFLSDGDAAAADLTYGLLDREARRIAGALSKAGRRQRSVMIAISGGAEFVIALVGCLYAGAVAVPCHVPLGSGSHRRFHFIVRDTDPQLILCAAHDKERIQHSLARQGVEGVPVATLDELSDQTVEGPLRTSGDHPAVIQYTSGSTGAPKGVMLTHANLAHNLTAIHEAAGSAPNPVLVSWLPMQHDMGLIGCLLYPLRYGGLSVSMTPESFLRNPIRWANAMSKYRASVTASPTFGYDLLAKALSDVSAPTLRLESLRSAFCGAESVRSTTLENLCAAGARHGLAKSSLLPCYGLAESTLLVSSNRSPLGPFWVDVDRHALEHRGEVRAPGQPGTGRRIVSCGQPSSGLGLRIVDPSSLRGVPNGSVGEIWIQGHSVATGYHKRPEETASTFKAYCEGGRDGPYLRTGDLGFILDQSLYITGRLKDLIVLRGRNIDAADLESTAEQAWIGLRPAGCAAFDASEDDSDRISLVAEVDHKSHHVPDLQAGAARVREAISVSHAIALFSIVFVRPGSLPRTTSGKIRRHACRDDLAAGRLRVVWRDDRSLPRESDSYDVDANKIGPGTLQIMDYLIHFLANLTRVPLTGVDTKASIASLGLDSLKGVQLSRRVAQVFDVPVPLSQLFSTNSIEDLANWIASRRERGLARHRATGDTQTSLIRSDDEQAFQPFPLTEMQEAYVVGRSTGPSEARSSLHGYWEFVGARIYETRLAQTWTALIERHPMLRAVLLENGAQRVLDCGESLPISVIDLSEMPEGEQLRRLDTLRGECSSRIYPLDRWPNFDVRVVHHARDRSRLCISLDCIFLDLHSVMVILSDAARLYQGCSAKALAPIGATFRDYVLSTSALSSAQAARDSIEYWTARLSSLPPGPKLPTLQKPAPDRTVTRRSFKLSDEIVRSLSDRCREHGLTFASLLLTAYADVIGKWSDSDTFCINVPLFNRAPVHPDVDRIAGHFSTFTLVPCDVRCSPSFWGRATAIQQALMDGIDHRHAGGVRILREIFKATGTIVPSLMPVVFTCAPQGLDGSECDALEDMEREFGLLDYAVTQTPHVWIDCQVWPCRGGVLISWDSRDGLFPDGLVTDMFGAFEKLIQHLGTGVAGCEASVDLLPANQRFVRKRINSTGWDLPAEPVLHSGFLRQAQLRPYDIALVDGTFQMTFGELRQAALALANQIETLSPQEDKPVAILLHKGWPQVVACLATLMSGRAYLPIDTGSPRRRQIQILQGANAALIILDELEPAAAPLSTASVLRVGPQWRGTVGSCSYIDRPVDGTRLAYVIYTSGSTGIPKGVMIEHASATNTILDINDRFSIGPGDRVLALSSLSFDLSVYDIFGVLAAGGVVVFPPPSSEKLPSAWLDSIRGSGVTLCNAVPAVFELLVDELERSGSPWPESLHTVLLSGDRIPPSLPRRIWALDRTVRVISLGGATEASIWSVVYELSLDQAAQGAVPYGTPLRNQTLHVLGSDRQAVPDWTAGDLYIGGQGLARGYANNQSLTQSRFIVVPGIEERIYFTGDRARYRSDGVVEILGRSDSQLKINGYRIELGEIESHLQSHRSIREAVVVPHTTATRNISLIAYVTMARPTAPETETETETETGCARGVVDAGSMEPSVGPSPLPATLRAELSQHLQERLPTYMMPAHYFVLNHMPSTRNGKIDRGFLQAINPPVANPSADHEPPGDGAEVLIARAIEEVLGIRSVGRNQSLFELGASSMQMVRVQGVLKRSGLDFATIDIFTHNTVRLLAEQISRRSDSDSS